MHLARAVRASAVSPATIRLRQARVSARFDPPRRLRAVRREFLAVRLDLLGSARATCQLKLSSKTCCTVRLRGWAVAGRA
nr:hypothetical protein [Pseudomonas monteilii]WMM93669.1 hypothetical protein [Pseudomonas monteilii]